VEWGILVQRAMNPRFIIIRGIPTQDPAQVRLPKYDHVVETFPSDRTDQSLDIRVLPRGSGCSRLVPNAHGTQPLPEDRTIRSVPVPNKICKCEEVESGLGQTKALKLQRPFVRRITQGGDADAARKPPFDGGLDQSRRDECHRYRHVDVTNAALLARGNGF